MSDRNPKQWNIWTPILVFFFLSVGILTGYFIKNLEISNQHTTTSLIPPTVVQQNDKIEEIISIISHDYLFPISKDTLFNLAIQSLFSNLDPHSVYIPASEQKALQEGLDGNFKGVGVEFALVNDTVFFTHIIPGSPAEEANLKAGDILIKADGQLVSGVNIDNSALIQLILGESGSTIQLNLLTLPHRHEQIINIKRGSVPLYSIDAFYLLDNEVGYIKINRFSATTYREFSSALNSLLEDGMESLIIDLRQNPGGYLEAAVAIADELLPDSKVIVSTENRLFGRDDYYSEMEGLFEQGPLVILIDEGSASASEILAGAIQDWDRGWIIGRRSFGKGLVQEVFQLNNGGSLKLTTSKYFTPSGRDIQRPYSNENGNHFIQYKDEVKEIDKRNQHYQEDTTQFYTKILKRKIHGGGGIKPDFNVPFENRKEYLGSLYNILLSQTLRTAAYKYYMYHSNEVKKYQNIESFTQSFKLPDFVLDDLLVMFNNEYPSTPIKHWPNQHGKEYVRKRITNIIARMEFGTMGYFYFQHQDDQAILKAINQFKKEPYLIPPIKK